MAFGSYEVGVIQRTPVPDLGPEDREALASLARRAWSLKRSLDTTTETSHAFLLPAALRSLLGEHDPAAVEAELARIQADIDARCFDLYGFAEADQKAALEGNQTGEDAGADEAEDEAEAPAPPVDALLSWAVGVAFGRFDWRLATGEREAPAEPEPFDPLPPRSPGMLPEGAEPLHAHGGVLVDDPGHPDDLARLIESALERVGVPVPGDVRRWLRRDFFAFHLQRYSRSRRKAPIYWPLSTASGAYTLWVYYPALTSQTLYTAVNDYLEPKLRELGTQLADLRSRGSGRSRGDEARLEELEALQLELVELRDAVLAVAPSYRPCQDDGAQVSAAPLWSLFRHRPWQRLLRDTWAKLERGDYDWARLAMAHWPERVREKCRKDRSLAIAHELEETWEGEKEKAKGRSDRNKG